MAQSYPHINDAHCAKHNIPIVRIKPIDKIGNAYGEVWKCDKCKGECEELIVTVRKYDHH